MQFRSGICAGARLLAAGSIDILFRSWQSGDQDFVHSWTDACVGRAAGGSGQPALRLL